MSTQQKISARGTYIFDTDDIDALDDVSLTSVMAQIEDPHRSGTRSDDRQTGGEIAERAEPPEPESGNDTINALLEGLGDV